MVVLNNGGSFSVINTSGNIVIDLGQVASVSEFKEDAALVKSGGAVYFIDKTGSKMF
jgi:hypothetical protein